MTKDIQFYLLELWHAWQQVILFVIDLCQMKQITKI
jgi:hypothetical protein